MAEEKADQLRALSDALGLKWEEVNKKLREAADLAKFERDCERVEHWMAVRSQDMLFNYC